MEVNLNLGGGRYPVGETANQPFQLSFNAASKVEFQGIAGYLRYRSHLHPSCRRSSRAGGASVKVDGR